MVTKAHLGTLLNSLSIPKKTRLSFALDYPIFAERELCKRSFYFFLQHFWSSVNNDPFSPNWHIEYICKELQSLAENLGNKKPRPYDLIINVPPGTTKTMTCSIMFPVWCWTRWFWMRFIAYSYSSALSLESAEFSRDLIRSDAFQEMYPELDIKHDKDNKSNFRIQKTTLNNRVLLGGNRYSTSVGGTVTGFHGHFLLGDDPLNPEQAASEKELEKVNRFVSQTMTTRKVDKRLTVSLLIQQRLHQIDPTGTILKKRPEDVKHICLPGEIRTYKEEVKPQECIQYYKDDLLDPVRMPWDVLKKMLKELGQYGYAGQVGQKPVPPGGGMFKVEMFRIVDNTSHLLLPHQIKGCIRYWDKACLSKGTLVRTKRGLVCIEKVNTDDYVLTRNGWNKVKKAWLSKYTREVTSVLFSNGSVLTGTPDHLVFSKTRGWIPLCKMNEGDIVCQEHEMRTWNRSFLMEEDIQENQKTDTFFAMSGISKKRNMFAEAFIGIFGRKKTEAFPKVIISTTRTKTGITMNWTILNVFPFLSIGDYIKEAFHLKLLWRIQSIVKKHKRLHRRDTNRLKSFVASVVKSTFLHKVLRRNIVPSFVEKNIEEIPVYDLSIEGQHEFFANGILVHNSTHEGGCATAGVKMYKVDTGLSGIKFLITDVVRGFWSSENRERIIRQTAEADGQSVIIYHEQEPGSGGKDSASATNRNLHGFVAYADRPTGDKISRADPYSVQVNEGVVLLARAEWNAEFLDEHTFFPFSQYKDQVDASAAAFNLLEGDKNVGAW